ncbi:MAG: hypothetical protein Hals2KO_16570 [Halioglobus sp.]
MTKNVIAILFALFVAAPGMAQDVGMDGPKNHRQILAMGLYPPDIIMRYQQQLGITNNQRKKMLALVRNFQEEVGELQWEMQSEQQVMRQSLRETKIDQKMVLPQIERVLEMESQFKLAHFKLLTAIKNELTEEQIGMIQERLKQRRNQRQ